MTFYELVSGILEADSRFVAEDGAILKNAVYQAAMQLDEDLITALMRQEATKKHFFKKIGEALVFDVNKFCWFISNREYMPDSYTRYKNKIGLIDEHGELISASGKVELVFPYKDCVLEGGQTREDQTREEIFYNETLAPDEVDRLFYPKVMCNAFKYECKGKQTKVTKIRDTDNLIIKGNNLLVLSSLRTLFSNKVRMVYWDVPYNTGSDSFGYNDRFSRSSWLLFIKNRVEKTLPLLKNDGGVFLIQCSFHQYAYLKVLLDEIIGNYIMTFNILVRHPERTLTADKEFNDVVEYVLVYAKSADYKMPKIAEEKTVDDYQYMVEELNEGEDIDFDGRKGKVLTPDKYRLVKVKPAKENFKIVTVRGSIREKVSSGRFYVKYLQPLEGQYPDKTLFKVEGIGDDMYSYRYFYLPPAGNKNGAYLQGMPRSSNVTYKPYPNFLNFVQSYNTVNNEGGVEFRNGKKPEDLIAFLMEIFTAEGDIVLDAFAGSGTTAAVAIKLNRQFIVSEQMDYIHTVTLPRIKSVIDDKETGLLPNAEDEGGCSFVYCELAKANQKYVDEIMRAKTDETINELYKNILETGFVSSKIDPKMIDASSKDFDELSFENRKRLLLELLDKNLLYVNYCDIEDEEYQVNAQDKAFSRSFYREE